MIQRCNRDFPHPGRVQGLGEPRGERGRGGEQVGQEGGEILPERFADAGAHQPFNHPGGRQGFDAGWRPGTVFPQEMPLPGNGPADVRDGRGWEGLRKWEVTRSPDGTVSRRLLSPGDGGASAHVGTQ